VRLERRCAGLRWTEEEFLAALRSISTVGHVAEIGDEMLGFLIYQIGREAGGPGVERGDRWADRPAARLPGRGLRLNLLNLAVNPDFQRSGIGRMMVSRLHQKIQPEGGSIQARVPESSLPAQLFFRAAGYRATDILRGHYDDEDAYLMERWCG
jgi:ribosomal-protein-alanine N-acetyltransferase